MNSTTLKGDWNVTKGKLKQKWVQLTDDDLTFAEGKSDELIGRIQKRTAGSSAPCVHSPQEAESPPI